MSTVEKKMSPVTQVSRVSSTAGAETRQLEALCERLLGAQPHSESLLKRLLARCQRGGGYGAFATIQNGRCSACNMTVATARIQKVKAGEFINCAHCLTFLYYDPS